MMLSGEKYVLVGTDGSPHADRARLVAPTTPVSVALQVGAPVAALLAEADDADLLVIGSRRLDPVTGLIIGSVGVELAACAPCPVVVVNEVAVTPDAPRHVVAGVDGYDDERGPAQAAAVLDFAFDAAVRTAGVAWPASCTAR